MITTTLNRILACTPCRTGWLFLTGQGSVERHWHGDDVPLAFAKIVQRNGVVDAFWALRTVTDLPITDEFMELAKDVRDLYDNLVGRGIIAEIASGVTDNLIIRYRGANDILLEPHDRRMLAATYAYDLVHVMWSRMLSLAWVGSDEKFDDISKRLITILCKFTGEEIYD